MILSRIRDTLYISLLTKYHTDVIVSRRRDLALTMLVIRLLVMNCDNLENYVKNNTNLKRMMIKKINTMLKMNMIPLKMKRTQENKYDPKNESNPKN